MSKARALISTADRNLIENVAYVIERERLKSGLTKSQQAAALNLSIASYYKIRDNTANLTLNTVADIAWRLGVSSHELLFGKLHQRSRQIATIG